MITDAVITTPITNTNIATTTALTTTTATTATNTNDCKHYTASATKTMPTTTIATRTTADGDDTNSKKVYITLRFYRSDRYSYDYCLIVHTLPVLLLLQPQTTSNAIKPTT